MSTEIINNITSKAGSSHTRPANFSEQETALPEHYGITRIVLLPRDPNWMYTYWDITQQSADELKRQYGNDIFQISQAAVRMCEVEMQDNDIKVICYHDINIALDARNWYLNTEKEGTSWYVELGLKTPDGRFIKIAQSNIITLPSGKVSHLLDEKWMSMKEEMEKVLEASGGGRVGVGSMELAKLISQRWFSLVPQISSWKGGASVSSRAFESKTQGGKRGFWFMADCELVLYGATESDAAVTVSGQPVELMPDGTFSVRFALPEGKLKLPIKAVSQDKREEQWIEISVERKTQSGQNLKP